MNLRKEILLAVTLILVALVLYSLIDFFNTNEEKADIEKFIIEDLENKHPNDSEIKILVMQKQKNDAGQEYYAIKAKVTENPMSACPNRIHYYYNYPEQNFITQPPEYVTDDCEVCKALPCTIAFEEEAIIASHTLEGTTKVKEYIDANNVYPMVEKLEDGWEVVWTDNGIVSGPYSEYYVEVSSDGQILKTEYVEFNENY